MPSFQEPGRGLPNAIRRGQRFNWFDQAAKTVKQYGMRFDDNTLTRDEEDIDRYLGAAKGNMKGYAILALDTGARPMELLALRKNGVHLVEGYVSLPGTKNVRGRRDVPLTGDAKEVLEWCIAKSPNGYIFPVRRPKTKHKEVQHITSLKKAHERIIAAHFADDPCTPYTFRHTHGNRHSQAGMELPVLAEPMGHSEIQTAMI